MPRIKGGALVLGPRAAAEPLRVGDDLYKGLLPRGDIEVGNLAEIYPGGFDSHDVVAGGNIPVKRAAQLGSADIPAIRVDRRQTLAGIRLIVSIKPDPCCTRGDWRNAD